MNRKLLLIAFILIVSVLVVGVSATLASRYCSVHSNNPFPMTFVNNTGTTVDIYWINYQCGENLYFKGVPDGESRNIFTFETHPWIAYDSKTGDFMYCFVATETGTRSFTAGGDFCQIPEANENGQVAGVPCQGALDGRINNVPELDCAPPVAIYDEGDYYAAYGIDPATGKGELVVRVMKSDIGETPAENTLLAEGVNVFTGQPMTMWHLSSGELQVNATYGDGKEYIFTFDADGKLITHAAA